MRKYLGKILIVLGLVGLTIVGIHAQRSTATYVQWDPVAALFHLGANGVDYVINQDLIYNCGTTVACANTVVPKAIEVIGTAPATAGVVTLTGLPYTSTTSYVCTASDATTAANGVFKIANASASSTVLTATNSSTDTYSFICIGQ
jgi:hypothetical protein